MKNQKLFSMLNNSRVVWQTIVFLSAMVIGIIFLTAQSVSAQFPGELTIEVGKPQPVEVGQEILAEGARAEIVDPTVARVRFDRTNKQFRIEGLKVGTTRVTFSGNYRGSGGAAGALRPTAFTATVTVNVRAKDENTETDVTGLPSERGKNIRIFYTSPREYDAEKAAHRLRQKGYVPEKQLTLDTESTKSQSKKLYCIPSSGGTEAGVKDIAKLVENIESVTTECLEDRPHTDPEYVLWIVSEQPFLVELKDYRSEIEEAKNAFLGRFGYQSTENSSLKNTLIEEFEKQGTGDWDGNAKAWSGNLWYDHLQGDNGAEKLTYNIPLEILSGSITNLERRKPHTPEDVAYIRDRMTYWRRRKEDLTSLLNKIIKVYVEQNKDYKERDLKIISMQEFTDRLNQRRAERKTHGEGIRSQRSERVFTRIIGSTP